MSNVHIACLTTPAGAGTIAAARGNSFSSRVIAAGAAAGVGRAPPEGGALAGYLADAGEGSSAVEAKEEERHSAAGEAGAGAGGEGGGSGKGDKKKKRKNKKN